MLAVRLKQAGKTRSADPPHSSQPEPGAAMVVHSVLAQHCCVLASVQLTVGHMQSSNTSCGPTLT